MDTAAAALISAALATCGWLYAARRARTLSRKQHTVNVQLQASFNADFQTCLKILGAHILSKQDHSKIALDETLRIATRRILNHYEFIAAGLRNGDFDEQLILDTERSTVIQIYDGCKEYIWSLRDDRKRMSTYEHLEWLADRWNNPNPRRLRAFVERLRQRPFQGQRHNHHRAVSD